MRVLHVHNFYQQPGGEDQSFAATGTLLENFGHEVIRFTMRNDAIVGIGRLTAASKAVWNRAVHKELRRLIRHRRPDVAHFENTFPLVSPAAYYACHAEDVPTIQTLRNFRLVCPSGLLYRNGQICEDCLGRTVPWPGILHGCYRGSRIGTAVVAAMIKTHQRLGTWRDQVDAYVVLNSFARAKFVAAGLPAEKLHVNPNFLTFDPGPGDGAGGYALFAGRLSPEKGINTLLAAWEVLAPDIPIRILGDGPEADGVAQAAARHPNVEWLGWKPAQEVLRLIGHAKFVVLPSACYENFSRVLLESFAKGTPIIASNLGSMPTIIDHRRTGLLFTPNDPDDLIGQVRWLMASPGAYERMRRAARRQFKAHYSARVNHGRLVRIYDAARAQMQRTSTGAAPAPEPYRAEALRS